MSGEPLVALAPGAAGIRAGLGAYPETAAPILAVAQAALRTPSPLSFAHRELIATAVSTANHCLFCARSHGAAARELLGPDAPWVDEVLAGQEPARAPEKLRALIALAVGLTRSVTRPSPETEARCRAAGADDRELHDTVLVAAAFNLFNRYVEGLGCPEPADPGAYVPMGQRLAQQGYR